jgi:maleylpyruvate isomerase
MFKVDLAPYKRVMRVYDSCMAIPAFDQASPPKQPDAE